MANSTSYSQINTSSTSLMIFELLMLVLFIGSGVMLRQRRRALQSQQAQRFQRLATSTSNPASVGSGVVAAAAGVAAASAAPSSPANLESTSEMATFSRSHTRSASGPVAGRAGGGVGTPTTTD